MLNEPLKLFRHKKTNRDELNAKQRADYQKPLHYKDQWMNSNHTEESLSDKIIVHPG